MRCESAEHCRWTHSNGSDLTKYNCIAHAGNDAALTMTYSEQYYYYYKYPHYSTVVGVPVGIGLCVLVLCISVVCQKKRRARQQEEEEAALAEQAVAESAEYHAMDDVAAADDDDEPSNSRSSSPRSPSINIGNALDHLSRHEQIGGDWDGFARRESGSSSPDSVYFQVRGLMTVGAHRDRIGSYTIDGVIDASCNSVSFHKTYASSQTTVEYDCQLWQEVCSRVRLFIPLPCCSSKLGFLLCSLEKKCR